MPKATDYYKQLGIPRDATQAAIEAAWKKWKRDPSHHPDTHPDGREKDRVEREFQERSAAYLILSKPVDRRKYDAELEDSEASTKQAAHKAAASASAPQWEGEAPPARDAAAASAAPDWGDEPVGPGRPSQYSGYHTSRSGSWPAAVARFIWNNPLWVFVTVAVVIVLYSAQFVPHAPGGNSAGAAGVTPDPGSVSAGDTPLPTSVPSPTPTPNSCPTGAPVVTVTNTDASPDNASGQGPVTYTVSGTVNNPTSAAVQIGRIEFYLNGANSSAWTDSMSDMTVTPDSDQPNVIAAGASANFVETHQIIWASSSPYPTSVSATLAYGNGSNWSWIVSGQSSCSTLGQ